MSRRVLFIADPHLAANEPGSQASFDEIVRRARAFGDVELVVVLGDCAMQKKQDDELFLYSKHQFERFGAPVVVSPGNQDVGNHMRPERSYELDAKREASTADLRDDRDAHTETVPAVVISEQRLRWFEGLFGPTRWARDVDSLRIVSIDSQLYGSGLEAEREQNVWLKETLRKARRETDSVVLCMHTPPYLSASDEEEAPDFYWTIPKESRQGLLSAVSEAPPDLLLTGHVHRELHPENELCDYWTLASSSFQCGTIWSVDTSRVPPGSDDLSFYSLTPEPDGYAFQRHILHHQDRYK